MLTIQQKAQCVLWYHKSKSPTAVLYKFRYEFGQDPSHINSIKRWFKNFIKTGRILDRKRSGRPSIEEEIVHAEREAFHRIPRISIPFASNKLAIPRITVHRILHKRLLLHAYKLFKLLSRMIAFAEQWLIMIMTILDVWFSQTKHLFMCSRRPKSITFKNGDHKILVRL